MKLIKFAANAPSIKKWGSNNPIQYRQRLCLPGQGCFFHAVFAQWQSAGLQNRMPQLFESSRTKTKTFCKQKTACVFLRRRSFYGRGWITQAAHLKKPRRGFFPRRTVRRVDAVRIHPPSLREGYYKTETPVPGSDTGVLGGAKQPKSEPLPSGASLAAISSKVMVFVPSL